MKTKSVKIRRRFRSDIVVYVLLALQLALWTQTRHYKPDLGIVPPVPSTLAMKAMALGDEEFLFRLLGLRIQNAGDSFGRFTALKDYNYSELYRWFTLLDTLESKSHFIPAMAGYYFSQTQRTPDVKYVVQYLDEHASRDLYNKWWWMGQAVYLANTKLGDENLALKLAYKLAATPRDDVPIWVKQMPAFIHEKRGEEQQALMIIEDIIKNIDHIQPGELNFMRYFVQDRLKQIIANHPELQRLAKKQPMPLRSRDVQEPLPPTEQDK